jgi:circadian clock protein KaiC
MERVSTGNRVIDEILGGGFPARSINIIMGTPGIGKTILAEQVAFAHRGDRPTLYLTTVSEPLAKVIGYLQEYSFADTADIGTRVIYESLADALDEPESVEDRVADLIKQHRPALIIIDSFKAMADLVPERRHWRRLLYGLAGLLTAYDATSFLVGEYSATMMSDLPEFAVADGILELSRSHAGTRDDRYLRVIKLRGSNFLDGYHYFRVKRSGLEVFVRLVTPPVPSGYLTSPDRLTSGVSGLDEMIESGWLRGTSTIVAGPSGAGKTAVGLHFLREGVARGEAGLLINFQENPTQLARVVAAFGWRPEDLLGQGKLDVLYTSPVELQIDSIVTEAFRRIEAGNVKRLVIDALGDMERSARDSNRYRDYLYAFTQYVAARGVTALFTLETVDAHYLSGTTGREVSPMSDNLLLLGLHLGDDLTRTIRVLKSRGSAHDGRRHLLRITARGLSVERSTREGA